MTVSMGSFIAFIQVRRDNIRLQVLGLLASQHIQDNAVGNQLHIGRVFLESSGKGGLGLGKTAKVDLSDGLADDG